MNHAEDALAFHRVEIRPHHVVVGKIHYIAAGKGTHRNQKKENCAAEDRGSHHHAKSKRTYRTVAAFLQERLLIACPNFSCCRGRPPSVAAVGSRHYLTEVGALGYNTKSAGSFT